MIGIRLGLLTLLFVRLLLVMSRYGRRFKGGPAIGGSGSLEYSVTRGRNRSFSWAALGFSIADRMHFVLRREQFFDRVAKWVGIAREWQTDDRDFDRKVFIISDDLPMLDGLSKDPALRAAILTLLGDASIHSVHCMDGCLWVQISKPSRELAKGPDPVLAQHYARQVGPALTAVKERLKEIRAQLWNATRDPAELRQSLLLGTSCALGIVGIVAFFWSMGPGLPIQLEYDEIEKRAGVFAGIALVMFLGLLVSLLGRTSRTHLVLLEILLVGTPGAWFTGRTMVTINNQWHDKAPAAVHNTRIVDAYVRRSRRSTSYYIVVERWPDSIVESTRLQVRPWVYNRLARGGCADFEMHAGLYGDAWIARIRAAPCASEREGGR